MAVMRFCLVVGMVLTLAAVGDAQYPPPYPPYYPQYGYGGGFGPGNVLNGQANVISAQGQAEISQQSARVEQEKANQAKVDTKRKTFDEMMYEKANTPTYTENLEKSDMMRIRRVMNHPEPAEVISGKSQNILLPYLDKLMAVGVQGPPVPLNQGMLQSINVTGGQQGADIGILRNGGVLDWPLALRGPTQQKLTPVFPALVSSAMSGNLSFDLYTQANKGIATLGKELSSRFAKDQIDGGMYLEGKHFLDSLQSSMTMIRSPNAAKYLNGTYAAKGRNVPELVYNMTSNGLKFAPATPGNDAPYWALQNAMVAYAAGAENSKGFRATFDPIVQKPRKDYTNLPP